MVANGGHDRVLHLGDAVDFESLFDFALPELIGPPKEKAWTEHIFGITRVFKW